jgi:hypothetical protein
MNDFSGEVQARLNELKAAFVAMQQWESFCAQDGTQAYHARLRTMRDSYRRGLYDLRHAVRAGFSQFDAGRLASLMAIPTLPLEAGEMTMHRIWLGGPLPALAAEALRQWQCAIAASRADGYTLALWVWDIDQLRQHASFIPATRENYRIGTCVAGGARLEVHSLKQLALARSPDLCALLEALHCQRRYVNLADFFRLMILHEVGGIYLDVDIMPYRAATVFLARPEVPDYVVFAPEPRHICSMNLIDDENGLLVAKRGNPALAQMVSQMRANLLAPEAHDLHDATYAVWRAHLGRSFGSYHQLVARHSILHDDAPEAVISGVCGMRLVVDAISGEACPLSDAERHAYDRCVAALAERGWRLNDPLELAELAQLTTTLETPRMAYAAQLRAQPESCHYYSFLSNDDQLDRVNALFGAYLMAKNAQRIGQGSFWCRTRGRPQPSYAIFDPQYAATGAPQAC